MATKARTSVGSSMLKSVLKNMGVISSGFLAAKYMAINTSASTSTFTVMVSSMRGNPWAS